jgi:hypothetical protein
LDRGQDAVDLRWAIALEILEHRGFVLRHGAVAVGALEIDVEVDAVGAGDGEPLAHQVAA